MIKKKENIAEAVIYPSDARLIDWAEQAPEPCIILTRNQVRYEGFSSALEAYGWVSLFFSEKANVLDLLKKEILLEKEVMSLLKEEEKKSDSAKAKECLNFP